MTGLRFTRSVDGIDASALDGGFFEGWAAAPSTQQHLALLNGSSHVAIALDAERVVGFATALMSEPASKRPASEAVADWIVLRTPSDSDAGDRWLDLRAVSPLLRAALSVTFLPTGGFEPSLTGEFGEVFDSFGGRLSSG